MPDIYVAPRRQGSAKQVRKSKSKRGRGMGPRYRRVAERLVKERKKGRLRAFNILPSRVRFETQEARERIILLLRQHWVTQIRWLLIGIMMVFVPLILVFVPLLDFLPGNYQFMAIVMWYLLLIAFGFERFIVWYFHVFIITDERIIDVDFYNMLHKVVSETKIDNIEDVTYKHGGTLSAWFNYGDVAIQTAAEQREFTIGCVPQPYRVAKILNELKLEEEQEKIEGRVR